ncbi:MAG: histidine--tRNA ligase [Candidatus Hadarchaeales archaeon]
MQTPKGTRDLFGEELLSIRLVEEAARRVFTRFCYQEVETPIFEHLDVFTKKSGMNIVKQIYSFKDKGGKDLALRPELTAPVIRFYVQKLKSSPKPLKLCYFGSCFRYEEPQAWRYRQFRQAGAEIIGASTPEADAELVILSDAMLKEIGLRGYEIRIGNVGVLRELLKAAGVEESLQDPLLRAIDSKDEKRIEEEFKRAKVDDETVAKIKEILALRGEKNALEKAKSIIGDNGGVQYLQEVTAFLDSLKVDYLIDMGIARGLDYYTGFVFEVYCRGVQIAGGGRYDGLIQLFGGGATPATGVGFGIDRISELLINQGARISVPPPTSMVIPVKRELLKNSFGIVMRLREAGIAAEVELGGRKLEKAMAHAAAVGARAAIIVGQRELQNMKVTVKDMKSGKQEEVKIELLVEKLKSLA